MTSLAAALLAALLALPGPAGAAAPPAARPPEVPPLPEPLRGPAGRRDHEALLRALRDHPSDLGGRRAFLLGHTLLKLGRHREAIEPLRQSLRESPELSGHALYFIAQAAEAAQEKETARRALEDLLRLDPGTPHAPYAHEGLARISLAQGRPREAVRWLRDLLRLHPDHDRAPAFLALLARALEEGGSPREAALTWRSLWLDHPESAEAAGALERAAALAPLPPLGAGDYYLRARRLQRSYRHRDALAAFRELGRLFPDSPHRRPAALHEALALFALRRTREAGASLEAAARLFPPGAPERAEARYHLARNHLRADEREAFEAEALALLRETPGGRWAARARYLLARVHESEGEAEAAARYYGELIRLHPASPWVPRAMWQLAWIQLGGKAHRPAFEAFQELARRFPDHPLAPSALYWSGAAAERAGEPGRAVEPYRQCAQLFRHQYYGHLALDALERLARSGNAEAARPPAPRRAGFGEWSAPPAAPLEGGATARWRAAEMLASMELNELAGEEFDRLGGALYFRYRAALAFTRGGQHDRAVAALESHFRDALRSGGGDLPEEFWRIAYPMRVLAGEAAGADPLLVNAVIKAESSFDPNALSPAGAMGLMQLMPATGRHLAKAHKVRLTSEAQLFEPSINVRLGALHLAALIKEFDGALAPAIASYNAGRAAVKGWWRARGDVPLATFIEQIPFEETRTYVKRVLGYYREYRRIYPGGSRNSLRSDTPS